MTNIHDIVIEIEGECGPKYETIEVFSRSLFKNVYYNAFRMTENVIETSRKHEKGQYERLYNIISFMGERGTGKTSVMNSFTDFLKNFREEKLRDFLEKCTGDPESISRQNSCLKDIRFMVLENIDASLLENKEDIFEVVLAKMLEKIVESMQNARGYTEDKLRYQNMKLLKLFDNIYKNKKNMDSKRNSSYQEGITSVELLQNLEGSMDLRESFSRMVPEFLDAVWAEGDVLDGKQSFLVLSIDDLDLNKERGFDMLEQIHRYFMVPRVLIYLAVSESQLIDICSKHFADVYDDSVTLARAYTDKVLPVSQRIYMPVLQARKEGVIVDKNILGEDRKGDPNEYDIKKTILWKIAHRTFVYFDGCGLKTHFYEPENVRELTNIYRMIQSLKKLKTDKCSYYLQSQGDEEKKKSSNTDNMLLLETSEINYNAFLDDIYNRMAGSRLNKKQQKFFRKLYTENVSRQGERFLHYIWNKTDIEPFSSESREQDYSFGEILRGIYNMGRSKEEEKPMIHCFLALETVLLTRLYYRSVYHSEQKEREQARTNLLKTFGNSIVGSWGNSILPLVKYEKGPGGNSEKDSNKELYFNAYFDVSYEMGYFKVLSRTGGRIIRLEGEQAWELSAFISAVENNHLLKILELLLMFVTNWGNGYGSGSSCIMSIRKAGRNEKTAETDLFAEPDKKNSLYIEYSNVSTTYDAWGFVIHSARYAEYFRELHEALTVALVECFQVKDEAEQKQIRSVLADNSLIKEYEEWEKEYGYAALPFYNIDLLYNTVKRVKRECRKNYLMEIQKDGIYDALLNVYENMAVQLKKEDEFYKDDYKDEYKDEHKSKQSIEEIYRSCPFIRYTIGDKKNEVAAKLKEAVNDFVYERALYSAEVKEDGLELPSEIEDRNYF